MAGHLRLLGAGALAAISAAVAAPCAAAGIGIVVGWQGPQPTGVTLGEVYPPESLSLNAARTAYQAEYTPQAGAFLKSLTLDAAFEGDTLSVPVRVWPQLSAVFATVYRITYSACSPTDLAMAETAAGSVPGALKALFTARALFRLQGVDACSPNNRRRAAKAWLDRAYELTRLKPYFELSPEAAAAYSAYDPAYVKRLQQQVIGAAVKLVNDAKLEALADRRFGEAAALNASLADAIGAHDEVRQAATELQGLTAGLLDADGAYIATRLRNAAAADPTAPVATESLGLELSPALRASAAPNS
jgi:hypothetical protein